MSGYEFSNEEKYELIKAGEYEVVLDTAEIKVSKDGSKRFISCLFKIREDVEQVEQGRIIFDNIFEDKKNPGQFSLNKLQKLLLVQGKEGKYKFDDDDELVQFINGLYMRITIENKPSDEYHPDPYNQVKYCSYKPSNHLPKNLIKEEPKEFVVDEADLPF